MAQIKWKQFAGQERIKDVLGAAYEHNTLGHAYLFCGEAGTGKFAAALELGMALLCKSEHVHPCYECEACRKVLHYTHPDFHVIMPVSLQKEHKSDSSKLTDEGWKYISGAIGARIANPYFPREFSTLPSIPVEWMRELNHAVLRGALEGGKNVAILDGVDTMNKESANSMLKTLIGDDISVVENPPTESYFEVRVMSGDSWSFGNNSVEEASIPEIIIEAEDVIENPQILNEDFEQALGYNGVLNKGDKLVIKDGKFLLNGEDVSERVSPKVLPKIHRRVSSWKYVELIREKIGVFDSTTFDESIFAVNVPKAKISMKWVRYQPATFSVKLNRDSLNRSKVPKEYVEEVLNSIKAAGVKVIVEEVGE